MLWSSGVLNVDSPKGLQRAVFFYVLRFFAFVVGMNNGILNHRSLYVKKNLIVTFTLNMVQRIALGDWLNSMLQINKFQDMQLQVMSRDVSFFYLICTSVSCPNMPLRRMFLSSSKGKRITGF